MLAIIFTSWVKPENQADFIKTAIRHAELSHSDAGNIRFDVLSPVGDEIKFIEIWRSQSDLDSHAKRTAAGAEAPIMGALRYDKQMESYEIL